MDQRIRDVMTSQLVTLPPEATLVEAAAKMLDHGIGDVLVVADGRLYGIVTDRDIVLRAVAAGRVAQETAVAEVCSVDVTCVSPDEDAERVASLMRIRSVRRMPVVEDGELVGVVSLGDLAMHQDPSSALADISAAPDKN